MPNPQLEFEGWAACPEEAIDEVCEMSRASQDQSVSDQFVLRPLPVPAISVGASLLLMVAAWWVSLELIARRQRHLRAFDDTKGRT